MTVIKMDDYRTEYGIFTDEGCIDGPLYGPIEVGERLKYWKSQGEEVRVEKLCLTCMEEYGYCDCEETQK